MSVLKRVRRTRINRRNGYALTVFKSPNIRRFRVRLSSDYPQGGAAGTDLILARASGAVVDETGGVPYGASGSPVYINDKVIGAISQFVGGDARLVGITPISAMKSLEVEPLLWDTFPPVQVPTLRHYPLLFASSGFRTAKVTGELEQHFDTRVMLQRPAMEQGRHVATLEPGGPIGVALMTGDLELGFVGTVTTVEDGKVLAFGHPLLFVGPTEIPMTTAVILDTARGVFPSKIGILGETIGTVFQDRAAGVFGRLGLMPRQLVTMRFNVTDTDRGQAEIVNTQTVHIPTELPFLAYIAATETVVRAMNRVGQGTAQWKWTVKIAGEEQVELNDEEFSPVDIANSIASSVFPLLEEPLAMGMKIEAVELNAVVTIADTLPEQPE